MEAAPFYSAFSLQDLLFMLEGAGKTLWLTLWSGLLGTAVGLVIGWIRSAQLPVLNHAARRLYRCDTNGAVDHPVHHRQQWRLHYRRTDGPFPYRDLGSVALYGRNSLRRW